MVLSNQLMRKQVANRKLQVSGLRSKIEGCKLQVSGFKFQVSSCRLFKNLFVDQRFFIHIGARREGGRLGGF